MSYYNNGKNYKKRNNNYGYNYNNSNNSNYSNFNYDSNSNYNRNYNNFRNNDIHLKESIKQNSEKRNIENNEISNNLKKNKVVLIDDDLWLDDKKFSMKDNGEIIKLQELCIKDKSLLDDVNREIKKYIKKRIDKHNIICYSTENLQELDLGLFQKLDDDFGNLKLLNSVTDSLYKDTGLSDKEKVKKIIESQKKINDERNKFNKYKKLKISELPSNEKAKFIEFFKFLSEQSNEIKSDFCKRTGIFDEKSNNFFKNYKINNIFANSKKEKESLIFDFFAKEYTVEEGTDIILNFAKDYENILLNNEDLHDKANSSLEEYSKELENNNKKISNLCSQLANSLEADSEQVKNLLSAYDQSLERDKKDRPFLYFLHCLTLTLIPFASERTKNILSAVDKTSNILQQNTILRQGELNEASTENIKRQLSTLSAKDLNSEKKLSSVGLDVGNVSSETKGIITIDYEKIKTKNKKHIKENLMEISNIGSADSQFNSTKIKDSFMSQFKEKNPSTILNSIM